MKHIIYLSLSIILEALGSTMLKLSQGFSILLPSITVIISYLLAFYLFSLALQRISLSTGYATWSGVGTTLTACIGIIFFHESLTVQKVLAIALIILGIVILNKAKITTKENLVH